MINTTRLLHALTMLLVMLLMACSQKTDEAKEAYDQGDFATALTLSRPLAEEGDAEAQYLLGRMYFAGKGVPKDHAESVKWYRRAAEQGNAEAQSKLGFMYHFGWGVPSRPC